MKLLAYQAIKHRTKNRLRIAEVCIFLLVLSACQTAQTTTINPEAGPASVTEVITSEISAENTPEDQQPSQVVEPEEPVNESQSSVSQETILQPENVEKPELSEGEIRVIYQDNPHAGTYIVDENGQNNTCARCHAPVNWTPSMDEIPESCFSCKFEIKDPPPYIAEDQWEHIPCKVCHEEGKKGKINPEIAWLQTAQIGEYVAVSSSSELCLKCHAPIDLPDHSLIQLGKAHENYTCTQCHDSHSSQASCTASGCHDQTIDPAASIPGHDADHVNVDCFACHDGSGLEVGADPETGIWTVLAYKSHQIELAAPCAKCHYSGNAWGLSVVEE